MPLCCALRESYLAPNSESRDKLWIGYDFKTIPTYRDQTE
jgi:hypothetical protein